MRSRVGTTDPVDSYLTIATDINTSNTGDGLRAGGGSKKFPRDFGLDTIGGMMDCDPMRFQRKSPSHDGDRAEILQNTSQRE